MRELLVTVNYRLQRPGSRQELPKVILVTEFLDQSVVLMIWQCPKLLPDNLPLSHLTSLLSVLDMPGKIIDFTLTINWIDKHRNRNLTSQHENQWVISAAREKVVDSQTSFHHVRPGVSHLTNNNYCVNAAPCRRLALGKCEKLCQPHRTGPQQEKRDC